MDLRDQILAAYESGDTRVGEIAALLGVPRSTVSYHLAALREVGHIGPAQGTRGKGGELEARLVKLLQERGVLAVGVVAAELGLSHSSVGRALARLEKGGRAAFVTRGVYRAP
jgi:DNA-binding transcriptional ArsR family regulator